jgi:integrase
MSVEAVSAVEVEFMSDAAKAPRKFKLLTSDEDFLNWMDGRYGRKTVENGLRSLRHIERDGVNLRRRKAFLQWMGDKRKKGMLDRTCNTYIKPYNRVLTYFEDPVKIKLFKEHTPTPQRATRNDYDILIAACKGYVSERNTLIIDLAFKCGLRLKEIWALTLDDIQEDIIQVRAEGAKEQKPRVVLMPKTVRGPRGSLSRYLRVRRANQGVNRLFTNMLGEPLTYDGLRGDIFQLSRRAGVHYSSHQARRFFARWMKENGVAIEDIAVLMGHSSVEVTRRYMQLDSTDVISKLRGQGIDFDEEEANDRSD